MMTLEERFEKAARLSLDLLEGCLPRQRKKLEQLHETLEGIREELEVARHEQTALSVSPAKK